MKVLLTGASGFIGSRLGSHLANSEGVDLYCVSRQPSSLDWGEEFLIETLDGMTDWSAALSGVQLVVHTAGRAHVSGKGGASSLEAFRKVNVEGTLNLARQAAQADVKRFIFLSSIGVNGAGGTRPFSETDIPAPSGLYGQSKLEAEEGLWEIQRETGMEIVIIRPPLVYGPHAPGNFGALVRLVSKGVPLPLGAVHNKRSLVALDNLVDLVVACFDHPAAANQVFLAGDGEDLSTTELLQGMGRAMRKRIRLIPVPTPLLRFSARLLGKETMAQSLLGSLQVDIGKARALLGWEPPLSVEEGLRRCFVSENNA